MSGPAVRSLEDIIVGQPRATSVLQRALEADRLFPSLVFHGPPGVGKLSTALLLCRALLCGATHQRPCGACHSCRRIGENTLVHPDVRLALPEKKSDFDRPAPDDAAAAGMDPQEAQAEAVDNPVWSVLIDRVRQGIGFLQRRPSESRHSILIVDQAHRMEAAAANALLKTLEEPLPHAVLILITPSWHALLPTIRSRCRGVPFQLVDPQGERVPNVILLYGKNGAIPPTMPKSVKLPVNTSAKAIHLLSGVGGWCYPYTKGGVAMIVRLHYADGKTEDHELINGEHFADYIRKVDVPKSEFAFALRSQQIRYLAVQPKSDAVITEIEFAKGDMAEVAPIVMAVTVETRQ